MDDVLQRLSGVESLLTEARIDIGAIKATLPHLATKADLHEVRSDLSALEKRLIRWLVGTTLAAVSVAFTIAKFVH